MRASNRAGAWTCEVMECMLVLNKYIITSQVPAPSRLLARMAASIIQNKHPLMSQIYWVVLSYILLILLMTCTAMRAISHAGE
jgi:hypothetical protein